MTDLMECDHDWEDIDEEEGTYISFVCIKCNAYRFLDLVNNRESISIEFEDGEVERDGNLYCGACGMLAATGSEEYDWCDHRTGRGCSYFREDDEDDEFSDDYNEFDELQGDIDDPEPRMRH